jgi:hypothetical protein
MAFGPPTRLTMREPGGVKMPIGVVVATGEAGRRGGKSEMR